MTQRIQQIFFGLIIGGGVGVGLGVALQNWSMGGIIGLGLSVMWVLVFLGAHPGDL
jgi:hypothetical protein